MALYRNSQDKRVFVPTKSGGVVLNFGHPIAWTILVCTTIVPFAIVAVVTIAVFL
ncbi:peptide ABC transporter substrate-binding protein [Actinoplanes sp. NPDC023714]|uniref:peptide ABC transporter substrate-binding protein n=1 Tax=Actinoplanes sp. NPDC023714 TaxID=3154322 RepID=UPI003405417B